jgi:predicted anti-sigma-YlaC factor YlaD
MRMIQRIRAGGCEETRRLLSEHLEGELGGRSERRVLRHLARCERCRAVLHSLARAVGHLRSLGSIEPPPSPSVADAVLGRIRAETP